MAAFHPLRTLSGPQPPLTADALIGRDLAELLRWWEAGRLKPLVAKVFPWRRPAKRWRRCCRADTPERSSSKRKASTSLTPAARSRVPIRRESSDRRSRRVVFQQLRVALAAPSRRPARGLALHDLGDHADQSPSDEHAGGRRHGRDATPDREVGYSSRGSKRSWPRRNSDFPIG